MRRVLFAFVLLVVPMCRLHPQGFFETLQRADSLARNRAYPLAVQLYEKAYAMSGFDPAGLGVAARTAALGGLREIAFRDLGRAIDQGYLEPKLLADSAFKAMRSDPRWAPLDAKLKRKIAALNEPIRQELIHLADQDQQNRQDFKDLMKKITEKSPQGAAAFKAFNSSDSAIQFRVRQIIAQIGWPTRSKVADDGAHAAWLIVQHMSLEEQQAMLPRLLAAIKAGEAQAGDGALLQDRVLARTKKPQLYGSQLSVAPGSDKPTLDPIENEACVDTRRKSVGLEPLAEYLKRFGIVYKSVGNCPRTT